jgi:hypothetical protein
MNKSIDLARQKRVPFYVNRNEVIDHTITVNDADGNPYSFAGMSGRLEVYNSFNKTDLPEYEILVTLTTGSMRFTRNAIDSKRENHVYKLFINDKIWLNGPFVVLDSEYNNPGNEDTLTISPNGDTITLTVNPTGPDLPIVVKTVPDATSKWPFEQSCNTTREKRHW